MDYQEFVQVLNKHIFYGNKRELLGRLVSNPERFIGLFRPSKPSTKILQHLLQSYEIRMGDALEEIIQLVIQGQGYILLDKNIQGESDEPLRLEFPSVWTNIHTYRRFKATRRGLRASMSPGSTLSPHNLSERLGSALRAYFFGGFLSFPTWDKNKYSTPRPVVKGKKLDVCLYKITRSDTGSKDQHFTDGKKYYFIEQKIRDDHDSTKKRGQMQNFEKKLKVLHRKHGSNLVGIMYFIDPDFSKNKNYYQEQIQTLRGGYEQVELYLFYGKQLFEYLGIADFWDQMLGWLKKWKQDLPEIPEISFDANPYESFMEIKDINASVWQKIISNDKLWEEGIIKALFRTGDTLKLIQEEFSKMEGKVYKQLANDLREKLVKYYGG